MPVVATTAHGARPAREVGVDRRVERVGPHRVAASSCGDRADVLAAEAGEQRRLVDRAVAVRRGVDDERLRLRLQAAAASA